MSKNLKNSEDAVFYKAPSDATEVRTGYLRKSPPLRSLKMELQNAWKRRYFVLYKVGEDEYYFKYFRSPKDTDDPLGGIDVSKISLLYLNPEKHQKWASVPKTLKCSPNNVLYIRAEERDFFLIGESSDDVDGWYCDLFDALKKQPQKVLNSEEMTNGLAKIEIISNPYIRKNSSAADIKKGQSPTTVNSNQARAGFLTLPNLKHRSMSEPSPDAQGDLERPEIKEFYKRRGSEPVPPQYNSPKSLLATTPEAAQPILYESMEDLNKIQTDSHDRENQVAEVNTGSLLRSVTVVYEKYKAEMLPLTSFEKKKDEESENQRQSSGSCSSSSGSNFDEDTEKQIPQENGDHTPAERELEVKLAGLKIHLIITDKEGGPSVSKWSGQQNVCLFHKGDQIVGINDLHISNVEEFNTLVSKSLKSEVKLTILRLPGSQPFHSPNCPCNN